MSANQVKSNQYYWKGIECILSLVSFSLASGHAFSLSGFLLISSVEVSLSWECCNVLGDLFSLPHDFSMLGLALIYVCTQLVLFINLLFGLTLFCLSHSSNAFR